MKYYSASVKNELTVVVKTLGLPPPGGQVWVVSVASTHYWSLICKSVIGSADLCTTIY